MALSDEMLPDPLPGDPMGLAREWLDEALRRRLQPNPESMILATADATGRPAARVVLCKGIDAAQGCVRFVSNYDSRKGRDLAANPHAAVVFHWDQLQRQLRIEGRITRASADESDRYFASRPWQSRVGAWASRQSAALASRTALVEAAAAVTKRFGLPWPWEQPGAADVDAVIPRPPHWGVYQLWVESLEMWVAGAARLHDRARWTRELRAEGTGFAGSAWSATRLQP